MTSPASSGQHRDRPGLREAEQLPKPRSDTAAYITRLAEDALGIHLTDLQRRVLAHRTGWSGAGLTQTELGELVGVAQGQISVAESDLVDRLLKLRRERAEEAERLTKVMRATAKTLDRLAERIRRATPPDAPTTGFYHGARSTVRGAAERLRRAAG